MLEQGPHKKAPTLEKKAPVLQKTRADFDMSNFHVEPEEKESEGAGMGKWALLAIGVIVVIGLAIFAVPAYKGYQVYKAMQESGVPEQYVTDMAALSGAKVQLEAQLADATAQLDSTKKEFGVCTQDLNAKSALVDSLGADLSSRGAQLESCNADVESNSALIANAAKSICCAQKALRDPAITGYMIDGAQITCVSEGGEPISC